MKLPRLVILLALALAGATVSSASASAAPDLAGHHESSIVGHAYVNDNTAGVNTIAAFDRHADGTLTPTQGSPFATGGAGTGTGIGSQGALQESADGKYLLAVDAGSSQISVLRIKPNGTLGNVGGGTVSSDGAEPVSIAVNGSLVYVANAGNGASNYTGFTLNPGGHLRALAGSTFPLADGSSPGDVLFNSTGTNLVGVRVATSLIDSFAVGADGRLTAAPGSPAPAQGPGPFGSEFRPTNPSQLFVSNAHGGTGNGTVSAFEVGLSGELTSIGASPFADLQTAPCWVEISHDGQFLFTVNTGSGEISSYAIAPGGSLTLLGSTPFGSAGAGAVDARLSPDGGTLLVNGSKAGVIASFAVNGGNLTELASSPTPLPAGAVASGIVVD